MQAAHAIIGLSGMTDAAVYRSNLADVAKATRL